MASQLDASPSSSEVVPFGLKEVPFVQKSLNYNGGMTSNLTTHLQRWQPSGGKPEVKPEASQAHCVFNVTSLYRIVNHSSVLGDIRFTVI